MFLELMYFVPKKYVSTTVVRHLILNRNVSKMWLSLISITITALSAFFSLKSKSWDDTKKGVLKFTKTGWVLFSLSIVGTIVSIISIISEGKEKREALRNVQKVRSVIYSDLESICKQFFINRFMFFKQHTHLLDTVTKLKPSDCLLLSRMTESGMDTLFSKRLTIFEAGFIVSADSATFDRLRSVSNSYQPYIDPKDFYLIERLKRNGLPMAFEIFLDKGHNYDLFRQPGDIAKDNNQFFSDLKDLWERCIYIQKAE